MMKSFFIALGFFTRLPVPKVEFTEARYRKAMKLMPVAGFVIGAILVLISLFLAAVNMPVLIYGAVLLCAYIILTGGLHFDGLADTCDGVFSGRSREQSLEIMKDSRIGVFGLLGIFMAGLLYFTIFTEAPFAGLLVFPLCGRACCLISASLAPYARTDGMGKATSEESGLASILAAVISIVGASFLLIPFLKIPLVIYFSGFISRYPLMPVASEEFSIMLAPAGSLIAAGAAILVTVCITSHFKKKLGGVTGDTMGAVIEVSSITYLFTLIILNQIVYRVMAI